MVRSAERERLGLKVVRCAYLARETRLVATLGVPSPIHGSIQETHDCYNGCAAFLLGRVRRGTASVMLATHNVQSGQLAAARAQELGIPRGDRNLQFAQLMGRRRGRGAPPPPPLGVAEALGLARPFLPSLLFLFSCTSGAWRRRPGRRSSRWRPRGWPVMEGKSWSPSP